MDKILVIEDSRLMQNKISDVLKILGKEDTDVIKLDNASLIFNQPQVYLENIKLIITDTTLPGISGIELTRKLKSHPLYKEIPIVFFTSERNAAIVREAILAGASDYIVVPIEEEDLVLRLKKYLSDSRQERRKKDFFIIKEEAAELIDLEVQRCWRGKYPTSFMVIKMDKDNIDKGLEVLKGSLRRIDILKVVEGKEVLVILPFTDEQGLQVVREKIKNFLLKEGLKIEKEKSYTYKGQEDEPLQELLQELGL
ncbi:Response regulator receiver domain-containing protein [Thermosyntropha lipolytica DSM 11003]|uniref:Stage 0 sporulation protein A homolog n=1 Tax=Thermosyntropha lipolytica DSM 11003 TaxID=1123382 RepID=A0A1M5L8A5_9FIRM|nr:response regulator [Thermosyntropha lipolytica]SHG61354.1 Response regulator receiver domain-containing protein [Thermosyntropha lipolytica DSM 11003]